MSTPELKPETPITDATFVEYEECSSINLGLTLIRHRMSRLESALNAAREPWQRLIRMYPNSPHIINIANEALAQIDKALSPQQSKTT